jgi:pre-rRNA-processing protein IPI3
MAATQSHLTTGSEDSNIHVWSLPCLLSLTSTETHEPLRSLSNHRAAITSLATGHSASTTNICVSASKDNTIIVWNYLTGDLLRTFLLPSTPLCLALDPCDRGIYIGFEDGSLQLVEFLQADATINPLYDSKLQTTPVQVTHSPWTAPSEAGSALCLGLSYDGTSLISGHASGKIALWDTGRRTFSAEITDFNAPVTNLVMLSPFPGKELTKYTTVVKPKLAEGNYKFTAQLTGSTAPKDFSHALVTPGFPSSVLEDAISRLSTPITTSSSDEKLIKEKDDLWKVIREQQSLMAKMQAKLNKAGAA